MPLASTRCCLGPSMVPSCWVLSASAVVPAAAEARGSSGATSKVRLFMALSPRLSGRASGLCRQSVLVRPHEHLKCLGLRAAQLLDRIGDLEPFGLRALSHGAQRSPEIRQVFDGVL